jgi:hypothetical protein
MLNKQKCNFFSFSKTESRKAKQVLSGVGGVGISGREENIKKGYRRVNMVEIKCAHVCKWKKIPVETIPGMTGAGTKESDGRANSTMMHCKNFYRCYIVLPVQQY